MPEPPQQRPQGGSGSAASAPATAQAPTTGKQNLPVVIAVAVAIVLVIGAGTALFVTHKSSYPATPVSTPTPAPVAAVPAGQSAVSVPVPASSPAPAATVAAAASTDQMRANWSCNQESGKTLVDASGNGNDAALTGDNVVWTKSGHAGGGALSLDGTGFAETAGPAIGTAQSFTATAWVNIAATDKRYNQTVISIDGDQVSGFFLMLNAMKTPNRFSFTRYPGDRGTSIRFTADGTFVPALNTWYHIAGVYDATGGTISLYVNGKLESTASCDKTWQAKGKTAIGRGYFAHKNTDFVNGMISDVRLYASALSAAQIQALAER